MLRNLPRDSRVDKGQRILVAEDEGLIALELEQILEDFGCEVIGPLASVDEVLENAQRGALMARCTTSTCAAGRFLRSCRDCKSLDCGSLLRRATTTRDDGVAARGPEAGGVDFDRDAVPQLDRLAGLSDVLCQAPLARLGRSSRSQA
jgi:hypothetical protein